MANIVAIIKAGDTKLCMEVPVYHKHRNSTLKRQATQNGHAIVKAYVYLGVQLLLDMLFAKIRLIIPF